MSALGPLHMTKHTGAKHTATVIFCHGSGSNGADMKEWIRLIFKNFEFPNIKVLYPTAPFQPYTPNAGQHSHVWFDRADVHITAEENSESLEKIEGQIRNLIKKENEAGIPTNQIIVGGFSMGGALALLTGYQWERGLAGVFALSSFLNESSSVYKDHKTGVKFPPLLHIHGDNDQMVPFQWGQSTFEKLKSLGVDGEFHIIKGLAHEVNKKEIHLLKNWIEKLLIEE